RPDHGVARRRHAQAILQRRHLAARGKSPLVRQHRRCTQGLQGKHARMIDRIKKFRPGRILGAALIASLLATIYWLAIASDRYVSESHVIIQRTDLAGGQSLDLSTLLTGTGTGSRADQLLLREHLLSIDMLKKLDAALNLRAHYSDNSHDL